MFKNQALSLVWAFPDTQTMSTDTLSLAWDQVDRPYLFTPAAQIAQYLDKIEQSCNMYHQLRWLSIECLVRIPRSDDGAAGTVRQGVETHIQ